MHITQRALVAFAALAFLLVATSMSSQAQQPSAAGSEQAAPAQPAAPQQPQAPGAQRPASPSAAAEITAEGELTEVNAKNNEITVKTATGEMKFKYDDSTKVTGGQKGVAGLATMTGSRVTVMYKKDGSTNTLTSIQVRPAAGATPGAGAPSPKPVDPTTRPAEPTRPSDPSKPSPPNPER